MVVELQPGDPRKVGPYWLLGRLGRGGMGRVFLDRSPGGRHVAVKVVRAKLAEQADFDAVMGRLRAQDHAERLLQEWTATRRWSETFHYLTDHLSDLQSAVTASLLARSDSAVARQFAAILELTRTRTADEVRGIVEPPETALGQARQALSSGDVRTLRLITRASPDVLDQPGGLILSAVLALADGETLQALDEVAAAADSLTPLTREARVVDLRLFRDVHPRLAEPVNELTATVSRPS